MLKSIIASVVAGVIVSIFSFGLGFVLNLFGTRDVLTETIPLLTAFLPHIGIGAIGIAVVLTTITVYTVLKKLITSHTNAIVADLYNFAQTGKEIDERTHRELNWRAYYDEPPKYYKHVPEDEYRFKTLGDKYLKWLAVIDSEGNLSICWKSEEKAIQYAEFLKIHGYIKGRWLIYKDRKSESVIETDQENH